MMSSWLIVKHTIFRSAKENIFYDCKNNVRIDASIFWMPDLRFVIFSNLRELDVVNNLQWSSRWLLYMRWWALHFRWFNEHKAYFRIVQLKPSERVICATKNYEALQASRESLPLFCLLMLQQLCSDVMHRFLRVYISSIFVYFPIQRGSVYHISGSVKAQKFKLYVTWLKAS